MAYISVKEASAKWGLGERRVRGLCQEGRVAGALRTGRDWLIPANAQRPSKGRQRKAESSKERLELYLNPTFCDNNPSCAIVAEERTLCQATDLFLKGRFEEASQMLTDLVKQKASDPYLLVAQMTLYLLHTANNPDIGKANSALAEIFSIIERNPEFRFTKILVNCVQGERPDPTELTNLPAKFTPIFAESLCYLGAMDDLAQRRKADPACLELLALMIDDNEQPACALYAHIALALYYNLLHERELYNRHAQKSLEIALPRKWYTPLANYAYALEWLEVKEADPEAYREVQRLAAIIMGSYIKAGRFGKTLSSIEAMDANEFKVAYMSARGMGVRDIATALDASIYAIRKTLKNAYAHTNTTSREELRAILNKQFRAI